MSTTAPAATAAVAATKPAKSKKLLVIGAVVLLLVVAGAAAAWLLSSRQALDDEDGGGHASASAAKATVVPTFLPMETMVVNLADPGGERFAQIGITLELTDAQTADTLKQFMPSVRSSILLLVSQRSSDELLQLQGKEQLARDVLAEVSRPLGIKVSGKAPPARRARSEGDDGAQGSEDADDNPAPRRKQAASPVRKVHFSSFIIQ